MNVSLRIGVGKRGCFEEEFQVAGVIGTPTFNPSPAKQEAKENRLSLSETLGLLTLIVSPCKVPGQERTGSTELAPIVCRQPVSTALGQR